MTFADFLIQQDISRVLSTEERQRFYTEYRKVYQSQYWQEYKKQQRKVNLILSTQEYGTLFKIAKQYNEKISVFAQKAILAYIKREVFLPPNATLENTQMLIRRSANNINQIVKTSHIKKHIANESLVQLVSELRQMEAALQQLYAQPKIIFKPLHLITNAPKNEN